MKLQLWLRKLIVILLILNLLPCWSLVHADSELKLGDVDGNGIVDSEDAKLVAKYVVGQIDVLPNQANADATQDGNITIEDALAIAQEATGRSQIVVAMPEYGLSKKFILAFLSASKSLNGFSLLMLLAAR